MLTLKVLFYRNNKAPVTLDSKHVNTEDGMTIADFEHLTNEFMVNFIKEYNLEDIRNIGARYTLQG